MDSHGVLLGTATRTIGETPGGFIFIGTKSYKCLTLIQKMRGASTSYVGVMGKQLKLGRHEGSQGRVMVYLKEHRFWILLINIVQSDYTLFF